jgi:hypothetical protein
MSANDPVEAQAASDDALAEQLMAALEAQFGERLDDASRAQVRQQVAGIVANSRALATYPLRSDVEPAFVFAPYPVS